MIFVFAVLAAIVAYYAVFTARLNTRVTALCLARMAPPARHSALEVAASMRLLVSGALQLLFLSLLVAGTHLEGRDVFGEMPSPVLIVYGVLLGIGEMALSTFLCNVAMRVFGRTAFARDDWFAVSKGGWMRSYLNTLRIAPPPLAAAMVALYVVGEEAMFRGIVISLVKPFGDEWAVGVSAFLFALAQTFNMPGWRNFLFPVLGATIVGIVHGALFLSVPTLLPLVVAHLVLFVYAAL